MGDGGLGGRTSPASCPVLVLETENDATFRGEAKRLMEVLNSPHRHVLLTDAEGAGEHCHEGTMLTFHQYAFDWIDETIAR